MSKTVKNGLVFVLIVVIAFAIIWLAYDMFKKEPTDANIMASNLADENTGLDNIINDLFENVIVNDVTENQVKEDKTINKIEENKVTEEDTRKEDTAGSVTSKEEKAIALVKAEWGGEDGVYFTNESIDAQGRYIVSVRDQGSTNALAYFIVDINKELVTKK